MLALQKFGSLCTISRSLSKVKISSGRSLQAYYSTSPDSDYIHKSKLPSDHFQKSLPRLPIPELSKTCQRYLQAQKPLLTNEEFAKTEEIVNRFRDGEGKKMHEDLVAFDKLNKGTSYITAPWSDMYLKDRRAVALNHNPFMAMKDDPRPEYNKPLIRATNMIMSSLRFVKTLRDGVLEPEIFHLNPTKSDTEGFRNVMRLFPKSISWYGAYLYKAFPLDMSQHPLLFNTNRIPRPEKDELVNDPSAKNLLVLHKGHLYTFECLDGNGRIKSAKVIMGYLSQILNSTDEPASHPVGVLTSLPRDDWTNIREKLVKAGNEEVLSQIDNAYFALVLDDDTTADYVELSKLFLHGDGTNRWFDKCFSLIMSGKGHVSVNFEHSWGDGVAVLRYFNEVYKDSTEHPQVHPDTDPGSADGLCRLDFNLTDEVKADIDNARNWFKAKTSSLDLNYVQYTKLGKNFIKKQELSPDSFMQLAIQLAYFRQYGEFVGTYESCSTSAFKHGRTETVRPCTTATQQACYMFEKSGTRHNLSELREAMNQCSKIHNQLTKEAAMGQGFDRHLFAMRYYANKEGKSAEIFDDPNYTAINHIILSTSTLSSPALKIGGFGAVVPDGYGIGYGIQDDQLGFIVTAYPPNRDVPAFLECLQQCVTDMASVLEGKDFK